MNPSIDFAEQSAPDLSLVIPFYNERDNLVELAEELEENLSSWEWSYEIILIDDGSQDGSAQLVRELQ